MLTLRKERVETIKRCLNEILSSEINCDAQEWLYNSIEEHVLTIFSELEEALDDEENEVKK